MAGTRPKPDFQVRPHPQAPLFSDPEKGHEVLSEIIRAVESGHFSVGNEEIRQYIRQAGLVSLWFFLKVIAGYAGPYNLLNDDLHLDMANFRQSDACMNPGARAAIFVPRSTYKSTICTHGADAWEIIRNPDIRVRIVNAINAKAHGFRTTAQRVFDSNEFFAWVYPELVTTRAHGRWSDTDMVVQGRSRYYNEPTIKDSGVGGAAEGDHHDLISFDDLVGLEDLDSNKQAAAGMEHAKNWYRTNSEALLVSPSRSRIVGVATRYAIDDVYQLMLDDSSNFIGYIDESFTPRPDGRFQVYYRLAMELNPDTGEEEPIFPEELSRKELNRIAESDMWTYMTQYINLPQKTGLAEFYKYDVRYATLQWHSKVDDWVIVRHTQDSSYEGNAMVKLSDCDVVMSIDPAGTNKGMNAKTSRSSIGVWAQDSAENCYRLWEKVGYLSVSEMFDAIFEGNRSFGGHIRKTVIESNAMQSILAPLLSQEELRRDQYINPSPVPAKGDKDARIRNTVGLKLKSGKIYLCEGVRTNFIEEKNAFPMSHKKDVLDETDKALSELVAPGKAEDVIEQELEEEEMELSISNDVFGY